MSASGHQNTLFQCVKTDLQREKVESGQQISVGNSVFESLQKEKDPGGWWRVKPEVVVWLMCVNPVSRYNDSFQSGDLQFSRKECQHCFSCHLVALTSTPSDHVKVANATL